MGAPPQANLTPLRNSYWVLPGKLLAGEHPTGTSHEATLDRLQRLIEAGVECFVDLTDPGETKRYDADLPFSVEYLRKPLKDHGVPAQHVHMVEILDCIHDALQSGRCVYVHCRAGIGRTGTVIGCLLVERGLDGETALNELNRVWQYCERSHSWPSIPETDEQSEYVRRWKSRGRFDRDEKAFAPAPALDDNPTTARSTTPWSHLTADPQGFPTTPRANTATRSRAGTPAPALGTATPPGFAAPPIPTALSRPTGVSAPASATARGAATPTAPIAAAPSTARGTASSINLPTPAASARAATTTGAGLPPPPAPGAASPPGLATLANAPIHEPDPLSEPEALAAVRNLRDRFLGALIGLATGDAVAVATQYRRPGTFTPVGDMLGGGPFELPRGAWTDDTAMALCLADSLLERDGFDARDQVERYRRWQQQGYLSATGQCVGITANSARAIATAQWRRQAFSGSHDPAQLDPEPLSRVAPAVLFFFATSGLAIEQATEAARTTCQAAAVLDACRSLARALYAALTGQPKPVVLEKAVMAMAVNGGTTAPAALTAAVTAFGATHSFRDAILYAANLGGDSDVIAAACGQLAGAYYGVKAIPTSWHNSLMHKELITTFADRLLAHAMVGLSG